MSHIQPIADPGADFDSFCASAAAPRAVSLFDIDCLPIVARAQDSADSFPGIGALVLCSIRQPFAIMPIQMADVARNGASARSLFGWKSAGFAYIQANKVALHRAAVGAYGKAEELDNLIMRYLAIPGLGIVKASFLAQMTVGAGACLDSHNLASIGLNLLTFRTPKKLKESSIRKRLTAYNAAWQAVGSSAAWWDSWCEGMAARRDSWFLRGAAQVSALHRLAITAGVK